MNDEERHREGLAERNRARLGDLRTKRPRLYASRHVVRAVGGVLLPLLGIGLAFALPLPGIDLPSIPTPDLPNPPDLPGWVRPVFNWGKFVVIIGIGVLVALGELEKRDKRSSSHEQSER
jgi:hypothetical protein